MRTVEIASLHVQGWSKAVQHLRSLLPAGLVPVSLLRYQIEIQKQITPKITRPQNMQSLPKDLHAGRIQDSMQYGMQ